MYDWIRRVNKGRQQLHACVVLCSHVQAGQRALTENVSSVSARLDSLPSSGPLAESIASLNDLLNAVNDRVGSRQWRGQGRF